MTKQLASLVTEEKIQRLEGPDLFVRSWSPDGKACGVVAIVPGFNAHSGRYGWVAEQLVADGLAVYALDLRGRGQSAGERLYVDSFDDYVHDVESLMVLVKSRMPGLPVFLLGHSAGGVVSCAYVVKHQSELAGLICEDFAFQLPAPDFALSVIKGISHVAPHVHVLHLKNEDFSRDTRVVQSMNDDPLIGREVQPVETFAALVRANEELEGKFQFITLPVLIIHGTHDKLAKPSGSELFYSTAGSTDKTLKLYDGYFHDMLNDQGKETVMGDITDWINVHL